MTIDEMFGFQANRAAITRRAQERDRPLPDAARPDDVRPDPVMMVPNLMADLTIEVARLRHQLETEREARTHDAFMAFVARDLCQKYDIPTEVLVRAAYDRCSLAIVEARLGALPRIPADESMNDIHHDGTMPPVRVPAVDKVAAPATKKEPMPARALTGASGGGDLTRRPFT